MMRPESSGVKVIHGPSIHIPIDLFTPKVFLKPYYVPGIAVLEPGNPAGDTTASSLLLQGSPSGRK